ncbi:hypothetical protein ACT3UJ_06310 [Halomonas sp. 86]|uniref:hypothetical protein n=1 Tax=unclassified Halomonas TaxID=2609666 RepID=UPI0040343FA9
MKRSFEVRYQIQTVSGQEVHEDHVEDLEQLAHERIFSMIQDGYREGELFQRYRVTTGSGEDEVSETYRGYWEKVITT